MIFWIINGVTGADGQPPQSINCMDIVFGGGGSMSTPSGPAPPSPEPLYIEIIEANGICTLYDTDFRTNYESPYEFGTGDPADDRNLQSSYPLNLTGDTDRKNAINGRFSNMISEFSTTIDTSEVKACVLSFQDFDIPYNLSATPPPKNYTLLTEELNIYNPHCPFSRFAETANDTWGNFNKTTPIRLTESFYRRTTNQLRGYSNGEFSCLDIIETSLVEVPVETPIYSYGYPSLEKDMCKEMVTQNKTVTIFGEWIESLGEFAKACGFTKGRGVNVINTQSITTNRDNLQIYLSFYFRYLENDDRSTIDAALGIFKNPMYPGTLTIPLEVASVELWPRVAQDFSEYTFRYDFESVPENHAIDALESLLSNPTYFGKRLALVNPPTSVLDMTSYRTLSKLEHLTIENPRGETSINTSLLENFPNLRSLTIRGGLKGEQPCPFLGQLETLNLTRPANKVTFPEKCSCNGDQRTFLDLEGLGLEGEVPEWATLIECVDTFIGTSNVFSSAVELTRDRIEAINKSDEVLILALEDNAFTRALPRSYCNDNLVVKIEDRFDPCTSAGGLPWWAWTLIAVGGAGGLVGLGLGISAIVKARKSNMRHSDKKKRVKYRIL